MSAAVTWDAHPADPTEAPSLSDSELLDYASAYVAYQQNFWAWEELDRMLREDGADAVWPFILRLVEIGSDGVLCELGAGLLEDLLDMYGAEFIERIEAHANRDHRFRFCLSHVWPSTIPQNIWERVVIARGTEPQRG